MLNIYLLNSDCHETEYEMDEKGVIKRYYVFIEVVVTF